MRYNCEICNTSKHGNFILGCCGILNAEDIRISCKLNIFFKNATKVKRIHVSGDGLNQIIGLICDL